MGAMLYNSCNRQNIHMLRLIFINFIKIIPIPNITFISYFHEDNAKPQETYVGCIVKPNYSLPLCSIG